MLRSLFETTTAAVLEEFFRPLSSGVEQRLAEADIEGWRAEVQARRRLSDAEFFRRIAPRVPISFGATVRRRRGHVPRSVIECALAEEEARYSGSERAASTLAATAPPGWALPSIHRLIEAAVVTWRGRAIVLPGGAETGRVALVAELVREGATVYSYSHAVLDAEGLVHPYPGSADGSPTGPPAPVGIVATMRFRPGRRWRLEEVSPALAALDLLGNALGDRDAIVFESVNRAVDGAAAVHGRRGPPAPVARALLKYVR